MMLLPFFLHADTLIDVSRCITDAQRVRIVATIVIGPRFILGTHCYSFGQVEPVVLLRKLTPKCCF